MKATRAYIASLGTSGLLLAFAASLLLVVGGLFAFNTWPGSAVGDTIDSILDDGDDDGRPELAAGALQTARDGLPGPAAASAGAGGIAGADGAPGGSLIAGTGAPDDGAGTGGGGDDGGDGGDLGGGGGGDSTGPAGDGGTGTQVDAGDTRDQSTDSPRGAIRIGDTGGGLTPPVGGGPILEPGDLIDPDTGEVIDDVIDVPGEVIDEVIDLDPGDVIDLGPGEVIDTATGEVIALVPGVLPGEVIDLPGSPIGDPGNVIDLEPGDVIGLDPSEVIDPDTGEVIDVGEIPAVPQNPVLPNLPDPGGVLGGSGGGLLGGAL